MADKIDPRFLSLAQASQHSGLSIMTLRRRIQEGRLRSYTPAGRRVLIEVSELDELILASRRQSAEVV
jgi:excisionase family DNA binding protein